MALGDLDTRWKNPQGSTPDQIYQWAQDLVKELRRGEYLSNAIGNGIGNTQLADMAAWTIKLRNSASAGDPQDVTINGLTEETVIDSTADFLPLWDTSGGVMRKVKGARLGGATLLTFGTVSNAATLDFVLTTYTAYRAIKFVLTSFIPATDDVQLFARVSTDGGSTFDAGATNYSWVNMRGRDGTTAVAFDVSAGDSKIIVAGVPAATFSLSNVANEAGAHVEVTLYDQTVAQFPAIRYTATYLAAVSESIIIEGGGRREAAQDTDAIRFLMSSGNITSGKYAVYGLA